MVSGSPDTLRDGGSSQLIQNGTRDASLPFLTFLSSPSVPDTPSLNSYITGAKSAYLCNIYYLKNGSTPYLSPGSTNQTCTWLVDAFLFHYKTDGNASVPPSARMFTQLRP